jgi:cellulose synthase (UDP-forming)
MTLPVPVTVRRRSPQTRRVDIPDVLPPISPVARRPRPGDARTARQPAPRPPALGHMHRLRPGPEQPAAAWAARLAGILGLIVGLGYCWWRVTVVLPHRPGILAVLVMVCEIAPTTVLARRLFALWSLDPTVPVPDPVIAAPAGGIAVLLPTYNEPIEILLPTVAAAVALEPAHQTWVLDDGRREEVRDLAQKLGASYATRDDNNHAKAGNLNAWLRARQAEGTLPEFIAVLDCDHVPLPRFLTNTLGYFDDPTVALVQVPQAFYNDGSFEHYYGHESFSEQELFFHVIQRAKNRRGAAFWCGSGGVIRTDALVASGGVATETVCEDLHTTLRLVRAGWRIQYHAEVLALGLAPQTAPQYLVQRRRWALGSFQVLFAERLWRAPWLSGGQRFEYLSSILWWFEGILILGFYALPCLLAVTGARVTDVGLATWSLGFAVSLTSRVWASRALARNRIRPMSAAVLQVIRCPASLSAVKWLITRSEESFQVTPKGRLARGKRPRTRVPAVLWILLAVCHVGMAALLGRAAGWIPGSVNLVTFGVAAFWLTLLAGITLAAIARIRSEQSGSDRRDSYRVPVDMPAGLRRASSSDGFTPVLLIDLSATGCKLLVEELIPHGEPVVLQLQTKTGPLTLDANARRSAPTSGGAIALGLQFGSDQLDGQARVAKLLFHGTGLPLQPITPTPPTCTEAASRERMPPARTPSHPGRDDLRFASRVG